MIARKPKAFKSNQSAENKFAKQLRKVAHHSAHIVEAHVDGHQIKNMPELKKALEKYSKLIEPWALKQTQIMMAASAKKNAKAFKNQSKKISRLINERLAASEVTLQAYDLQQRQVELIKSIPIEAGNRAQLLAQEAVLNGTRADEIAQELLKTQKVTESRAMLIARTEVAKANAALTQVRAKAAGARGYIWRTTMDGAERPSHRKMNDQPVSYSNPPTLDGMTGHAGEFPNCRCWQDPIFDE